MQAFASSDTYPILNGVTASKMSCNGHTWSQFVLPAAVDDDAAHAAVLGMGGRGPGPRLPAGRGVEGQHGRPHLAPLPQTRPHVQPLWVVGIL